MADIILAALVFAPLILTIVWKSNAALAFLALCAGFAIISFTNINIQDLTKNLSFQITSSTFNLCLVIAPFVLTLLLCRKGYSSKVRMLMQCAAALCGGALLALVAIPLLSESVRQSFVDNPVWSTLQKIQPPVVAGGAFLSLILIWFVKPSHHDKKSKHK